MTSILYDIVVEYLEEESDKSEFRACFIDLILGDMK